MLHTNLPQVCRSNLVDIQNYISSSILSRHNLGIFSWMDQCHSRSKYSKICPRNSLNYICHNSSAHFLNNQHNWIKHNLHKRHPE